MTKRIRQTLILATLAAAVVAVAAGLYVRGFAQTPPASAQGSGAAAPAPDVILSNGKIITVDAKFSIAQAVAIQGERILAVGTNQDINRLAGPATRRIDLRGRSVIPGLIDNHAHYME